MRKFHLFAVSQPGIESLTLFELKNLDIDGKAVAGGVEFEGGLREIYLTNLWLKTANRILIRLGSFRAKHFAELVRKASKCPWGEFLRPEMPIKIRVTSRRSKLYHTKAVKERIKKAMEAALGHEIVEARFEEEGTSVIVRLEDDVCTISLNSSGSPLHKRGYRVMETEAPLRENLAAALILFSGWDGESPLVDPFCGSGTIPIEAALMAANIPPGLKRDFAFMKFKNFDEKLWEKLLEEAKQKKKDPKTVIYGFDIDDRAVLCSIENAKKAGIDHVCRFRRASLPRLKLDKAFVVTNPPYGVRMNQKDLETLYERFGRWVKECFKAYRVVFITNSRRLALKTGLSPKLIEHFSNGGITVGVWLAERST